MIVTQHTRASIRRRVKSKNPFSRDLFLDVFESRTGRDSFFICYFLVQNNNNNNNKLREEKMRWFGGFDDEDLSRFNYFWAARSVAGARHATHLLREFRLGRRFDTSSAIIGRLLSTVGVRSSPDGERERE